MPLATQVSSSLLFFFSNFPNTFSNQIFLNQSNKTNISTPQNKINAIA
jgi:hypothetical protein